MRDVPSLTWLNFKTHPQSNGGKRNNSGHGPEHAEAFIENASRIFAAEVEKALIVEAHIGEYADHEHNTLKFEGDRLVEDELGLVQQ